MNNRVFDLEFVGFCGFYETLLGDYLDDNLNCDLENMDDSLSKLKINEFNCFYNMDYKQYMKDVADVVMAKYISDLETYLRGIVKLNAIEGTVSVHSPREYNFTTDRVFQKVYISEDDYEKLVQFIKDNSYVATKFFHNHFTSYDGFTSFYSNKLDEWTSKKFNEVNELELSYLIRCALVIRLYNNTNWRYNNDGDEVNDVAELERNYTSELEDDVYEDMETPYSDYVDWGLYQKELRRAIDRERVMVKVEDVLNDTLWWLTDNCKINEHNELVLK